jgi:alkylation response protein AidB-like acyl-CoA dehydrogenase
MDFDLSDDQLALRDGARELLDGLASPAHVRRFTEHDEPFDADLWGAMVEQGWLGVALPEDQGGLGLGVVELAVLLEELGRHAAPVPYLPSVLVARAAARAGAAAEVAQIVDGAAIGTVAWSANGSAVRAESGDAGWVLRGRPDPTVYGPVADIVVVPAWTADGPALFLVHVAAQDRPARQSAIDLTRPLAWIDFDATPALRLGGADAVDALLDDGAALTAAEMLGGARAVLDMTVAYAKDRVQFGRPIGSFQAVKHRCADMLVDVEGMHSTAYWAAWALGAEDPDASIAASTAKSWCSDAAKRVMASGLQVHGGIGFTWEHDLHFFSKRSHLDQLGFGDGAYHRRRLTELLRPRVEAGSSVV